MKLALYLTLVVVACAGLSACGGGLFGTGTGDNDEVASPVDATDSPGTTPTDPVTTPTDPEATPGPAPGTDISPDADTLMEETFTNTEPSGLDIPPQIKIVNVSSVTVNARLEQAGLLLFSTPIAPESTSTRVELPLGDNQLSLFDSESGTVFATFNPLTVGAGSLTTLLLHAPLEGLAGDENYVEVLPLDTRLRSTAADLAMVRLVQGGILDDANQTASFVLSPQGPNPGSSEVIFSALNSFTDAASDYQLVSPGDYVLSHLAGDFPEQALSFEAGAVYTLVLRSVSESPVYLEVDGAP
jgi:hypothetical protein